MNGACPDPVEILPPRGALCQAPDRPPGMAQIANFTEMNR